MRDILNTAEERRGAASADRSGCPEKVLRAQGPGTAVRNKMSPDWIAAGAGKSHVCQVPKERGDSLRNGSLAT